MSRGKTAETEGSKAGQGNMGCEVVGHVLLHRMVRKIPSDKVAFEQR